MIHASALVHPTAQLDPDVEVGPFAIIEAGVKVGAGSVIAAHAIIKAGTSLGGQVRVDHFAVVGATPGPLL